MFLVTISSSSKEQSLHVGNSVFGFRIFGVQFFFFFLSEMDICHVKKIHSLQEIYEIFQPTVQTIFLQNVEKNI